MEVVSAELDHRGDARTTQTDQSRKTGNTVVNKQQSTLNRTSLFKLAYCLNIHTLFFHEEREHRGDFEW